MEAAEVVQLFVAPTQALLLATPAGALPQKTLKGFARVTVKPGQHQTVQMPLSSKDFQYATSGEGSQSPFPYCESPIASRPVAFACPPLIRFQSLQTPFLLFL